ncbi:MAG: hypothetical protein NT151_13405 [Acidobacteria bacterium]|nr:hypothetical protein [Acidobacteriota bacterium]
MAIRRTSSIWLALAFVVAAGAAIAADTMVMRNGDQVRGQLVAIRNGEVEFREERGFNSRTIRVNLREVQRIDFDDELGNRGNRPDETRGPQPQDTRRDPNDGPAPGMREHQVVVSANVPWVDAGIEVRDGQRIFFRAVGQVTWGKGRKDGPEGEKNSPFNAGRPIPNRPGAGLIGKVGERSSDPFFIGDEQGAIRVRGTGRLFLGINDDNLRDNTGNWRVTIYY